VSLRAVLFDLDDTLLEYSAHVAAHWAAACGVAATADVDPVALAAAVEDRRAWFWSDEVRHRTHRTDMLDAWTRIAAAALVQIDRPDDALAARIAADFASRRRAAMVLYPDARACLAAVRAAGLRLGLVTNGDARLQREKTARFDLAACFDAIVVEGEFGCGKPDPRVYRHVLERLDVAPGAAMMIGDHLGWDVEGAQRVGIAGVWIDRLGRGVPATSMVRPCAVVHGLDDVASVWPRRRPLPVVAE
jgi:putative hydrolase of the HAD superfamily